MRFLCDSCQTRYTLADEKVRGRVLRVRCKTCGAAIVVRESGAQTVVGETPGPLRTTSAAGMARVNTPAGGVARATTPAGGVTRPAEPSTPPRDPSQLPVDWFAMLAGKQEGPFTEKAILARIVEGSIGPRTFIWSESMSDWKRASEVPAFASRFAEPVTPPRPPPAPRAEFDPFASVGGESALTPVGELVPVVDPHSLTPSGIPRVDSTGESTRLVMMQAGVDSRGRKKRAARIVIIGGAFVALAGLTVLLLPTSVLPAAPRAPGGKVQGGAPWTAEGMEALRDKLLGRDADGQVVARPGPRQARPRDDGAVIHRQDPKPSAQVSDATKDELANLYGDTSKRDAKIEVKTAEAPKADKAALDPSAISKTVSDNAGAYKRCIDDYLRRNPSFHGGKVEITATIAPSGIVTAASLSDRSVDGSDLGACLRDRTKRMIFPRFEGDPFDVTYPLVLASGGE